jgi:hypothetical protein
MSSPGRISTGMRGAGAEPLTMVTATVLVPCDVDAVTVNVPGFGPAVYKPVPEIAPPLARHSTFASPIIVAENCSTAPVASVTFRGETTMLAGARGVGTCACTGTAPANKKNPKSSNLGEDIRTLTGKRRTSELAGYRLPKIRENIRKYAPAPPAAYAVCGYSARFSVH